MVRTRPIGHGGLVSIIKRYEAKLEDSLIDRYRIAGGYPAGCKSL